MTRDMLWLLAVNDVVGGFTSHLLQTIDLCRSLSFSLESILNIFR